MGTPVDRASHLAWKHPARTPGHPGVSRCTGEHGNGSRSNAPRPAGQHSSVRVPSTSTRSHTAPALRGSDGVAARGDLEPLALPGACWRCNPFLIYHGQRAHLLRSGRGRRPFSQSEGDWGSEGSSMWFGGCGMASLAALRRGMGLCSSAVCACPASSFYSRSASARCTKNLQL